MTVIDSPIRRIRQSRGLTVERLAAMAELASATVYRAERGEHRPTKTTIAALARVLDVPTVSLVHAPDAATPAAAGGTDDQHQAPDLDPSGDSRDDGIRAGAR